MLTRITSGGLEGVYRGSKGDIDPPTDALYNPAYNVLFCLGGGGLDPPRAKLGS